MRLVLLALLAAPQALYACTCIDFGPKTSFKNAEAVFLGEVIDYDGTTVRLRPEERFKAAKEDVVALRTADPQLTCGYGGSLTPGSRHLIYVWGEELSLCSRSRPLERAECDLRYLRSRAGWWRSPLSSLRIGQWLGMRWEPCP